MNDQSQIVAVEQQLPAVTPMHLLQIATQQGADVDKLGKLMDLQIRWEAEQARKAYVAALAKFKANPPRIIKDKAVSFGSGKAAYKHAKLDTACEAIGAALSEHGLSHTWEVKQEAQIITVTCILTHELGHSERVSMSASPDNSGSKNAIQAVGSAVSYLQRYTLFAATGLAPHDADDDGNGGRPNEMPEGVKSDWLAAIEALADDTKASELWQKISASTAQYGDVAVHDELRAALQARRKALKVAK